MNSNLNDNKKPVVTILMAVYNGEKYLKEAIESILNQTFTDFEFLIINDGSTDSSEKIINSYKDQRIRLINNNKNLGLATSLNIGIDLSKGKYIARMDADDISLPKRLEIQVRFMDKHTKIGIAGSWVKIFGEKIKNLIKTYPSNTENIKAVLLFKNAISHPTVIIRKVMFDKYNLKYNENLNSSQDYELWTKAIKYFPIVNIKQVLLLYRIHNDGITQKKKSEQQKNSIKIKTNQLLNLNIILNEEEISIYKTNYISNNQKEEDFLNKKGQLLLKMKKQNEKIKYYKEPEFSKTISRIWFDTCTTNIDTTFKLWKVFFKFPLQKGWELKDYRFILKCFLNRMFKKLKYLIKIILNFYYKIINFFLNIKAKKIMGKIDIKLENEKGISIVILSFNRKASLKKLLKSLLQQELNELNIEVIICNNYKNINIKKSKFTKIGALLNQFDNLKILNSSHNWRTDIRYSISLISKYEIILFIDDDIFFKKNNFIQYMYDRFKTLKDADLLSCWNTIWTEYDDDKYFKFARVNFTEPDNLKELIETDTCGMGICMFNKKILYRENVFKKSLKYHYADDMSFPLILNMEVGGKNYYLPSFDKISFHKSSGKFALCNVEKHYTNLFLQYKELYKKGYIPVIERNPKSKKYIKNKKEKKYSW